VSVGDKPAMPSTRGSVPLAVMRARLEGTLIQAAKTALASGISWYLAADPLAHGVLAVFAPLAALLTVQVTIWQSVARGLQRVLGVVVGVLVAGGFGHLVGVNAWSVALTIFIALLLGRALRLGVQGSIQVPVSALLVLVLGAATRSYGIDRVIDTALGAGTGIVVNLVVFPPTHIDDAASAVASLARTLGSLLRDAAASLDQRRRGMPSAQDLQAMLDTARQLGNQVGSASDAVRRAAEACRWNPAGRRRGALLERLRLAIPILEMVERQVRGITRAVAEAGPEWALPARTSEALGRLLEAVAGELDSWPPVDLVAGSSPAQTAPRPAVDTLYVSALRSLRGSGLPPQSAALATSIAVDAHRIREELAWAPAPSEPALGWTALFDRADA